MYNGERTKKSVITLSIVGCLNLILAFIKLFVGLDVNSLCILSDSINNFLDVISTAILIIAFACLGERKSSKYPFGNGRSEYVAGIIVALVTAVTGVVFLMDSINRIIVPEPIWYGAESTILISCTVCVKIGMGIIVWLNNKKLRSKALSAVVIDCFLDAGITAVAVIGFTLTPITGYVIDSFAGIAIAVMLLVAAIKIIKSNYTATVSGIDRTEEREKLKKIVLSNREEVNAVKIDMHDYGRRKCIAVITVEFKRDMRVSEFADFSKKISDDSLKEVGIEVQVVPTIKNEKKL